MEIVKVVVMIRFKEAKEKEEVMVRESWKMRWRKLKKMRRILRGGRRESNLREWE